MEISFQNLKLVYLGKLKKADRTVWLSGDDIANSFSE